MSILLCLIIIGMVALIIYGVLLGLPSTKGPAGERLVRIALRLFAPRDAVIFHDLYFHNGRRSCQIDHLIVAPTGIFVIETKTFLGEVSGDALAPIIRRRVLGRSYSMRNPVEQNEYHLRYLCENFKAVSQRRDALRSIIVYTISTRLRLKGNPGYIGTILSLPEMLKRNGTSSLNSEERLRIITELHDADRRK